MKHTVKIRVELTPDEVADVLRKHFVGTFTDMVVVRTGHGDTWNEGAIIEWNEEANEQHNRT
jgi:hypothetical protein